MTATNQRQAAVNVIASIKQPFCDERLTSKLDRREIDDLADAIVAFATPTQPPGEPLREAQIEAAARAIAGTGYGEREHHPWDCLKRDDPEDAALVREQAENTIDALAALSATAPQQAEAGERDGLAFKPLVDDADGPAEIFLQPLCSMEHPAERRWSECDDWEECGDPSCKCASTRYVRDAEPRLREVAHHPIETAPKDGTIVDILVDYSGLTDDRHALINEDRAWTIGFNSFDDDGEDVWKFAGFCWTREEFAEGKGEVVGWRPRLAALAQSPAPDAGMRHPGWTKAGHAWLDAGAPLFDATMLEKVAQAADAWRSFVAAREAMNAAKSPFPATPAENALYDERYRADHEAEREHHRTAIILAQHADAILAALSHPQPIDAPTPAGEA